MMAGVVIAGEKETRENGEGTTFRADQKEIHMKKDNVGGAGRKENQSIPAGVEKGAQSARIEFFEDLQVWQRAIDLAASVYTALEKSRDFSLRDQIQRAAVSVSSNIAEGYERGTNPEFIRFLYYAKGSCGEVRSQLHVARRIKLMADETAAALLADARLLSQKLGAFIKVRKTRFS